MNGCDPKYTVWELRLKNAQDILNGNEMDIDFQIFYQIDDTH